MLTEECGFRHYMASVGIDVIETDLGERIQQLDHEDPSHVVVPAVHKLRTDVAEVFARTLGTDPANSDVHYLAEAQREANRPLILAADAGMTGCNFAVAETGAFVVCTNEGNADLSANVPKLHIASIGIEKIIPLLRVSGRDHDDDRASCPGWRLDATPSGRRPRRCRSRGVAGGALPMSAGTSFHGRRKPNGSACQRRTMAGGPGGGEARDERDVPVEVLRGREAPAPAVDAEQGAGAGRRRRARGTRPAVHVQLEAPRSPGPDDRRPGGIVHERDGRRDGDRAAIPGRVTQVRRGAGRKEQNVIAGAGSARPVQVLGRCATRAAFDQQSDRVELVGLAA
jgi:LUD domain